MSDTGQNLKTYRITDAGIEDAAGGYQTIIKNRSPLIHEELPQRSKLEFASVGNIQDNPGEDKTVVFLNVTGSGLNSGRSAMCVNGYVIPPGLGISLGGTDGPLPGIVAFPQWAMSTLAVKAPAVPLSTFCIQLGFDMVPAYGLSVSAYGSSGHLYVLKFGNSASIPPTDGYLDTLPQPNEVIDFGGAYWWKATAYTGGS